MPGQTLGKRKHDDSDNPMKVKLQNMKNIREAFRSIDISKAQAAVIIQATFGLIDQNNKINLTPDQHTQLDVVERQTLSSLGAEVYPTIKLTHKNNSREQSSRVAIPPNKGGKSNKKRSNKNKKSRRSK
jgi:hypothetical protein